VWTTGCSDGQKSRWVGEISEICLACCFVWCLIILSSAS
jgi:hypothetical protein